MSREVEDRIAAVANAQRGVATQAQLLQAGLSASALTRRLRAGRLRRLHRGVYLVSPIVLPLARELAAVLATDGVLSHESAGWVWGACPEPKADARVEVSAGGSRGHRPGIRVHRVDRLGEDEWTVKDGIPITTPARTLLDLAAARRPCGLEAVVARAERAGLVTAQELEKLLERHRGHAGARALAAVLRQPGGPALTRSEAEAKLLALVREARLPTPECNVSVGRYEVDFLWRSAGLAVEVDGFRYHSSHSRFEGDRRKDAQLVASGLTVLRISWRPIVHEPMATVAQLAQALARVRR